MRTGLWTMAAIVAATAGLGWTAGRVFPQDMGGEGKKAEENKEEKKEAPAPGQPSKEEMAAWMKFMTPGEEHKHMASQTGEWTVKGKMWMAPEAPPTEMTGSATFRMIFGGRYQVHEYKSVFMGMPFEGMSITSFDNATKEYTSTWIDSMGTGMMITKGKPAVDGVQTCTGTMTDPQAKPFATRMVATEKDADTFVLEMYARGADQPAETKSMELVYSRKK